MNEILPRIYHWTTMHEDIGQAVHSYFLDWPEGAVLIDPMLPPRGLEVFEKHSVPRHILLTNRLHYRHSARFVEAFGASVACHRAGLHEFSSADRVRGFEDGDEFIGGIVALNVGALCPEETAFLIPESEGVLALGDAVIRRGSELSFVPDELMGGDPESVKRGLSRSLAGIVARDFDHLLMAHGEPWIGGGKSALQRFVGGEAKQREIP
jgi:hypothetical protein